MSDDDTRYSIVTRRVKAPSPAPAPVAAEPAVEPELPPVAPPAQIAQGSKTIPIRNLQAAIAAEAARNPAAVLPRVFGGTDVVVEAQDGQVALVLPGAIRLVGTRDEATALAAALLRAAVAG